MTVRSVVPTPLKVVLFDADGVVQFPKQSLAGWRVAMGRMGGRGFWQEVCAAERRTLRGEADLKPLIEDLLRRRGSPVGFDELLRAWAAWYPVPAVLDIVRRLRTAGILCVLATNQQSYRGAFMQRTHGYQDVFDATFYSYEVGAAKPDAAFFEAIGKAVGARPDEMLLIDDHQPNVEGARRAGLRGLFADWTVSPARLAELLRAEGLPL